MKNLRGFVSVTVSIAILFVLLVVGGGAYYVTHKNLTTQTPSQNPPVQNSVPADGTYLSLSTQTSAGKSHYAYEGKNVYFGGALVQDADLNSFVVLNSYLESYLYGRDKNRVYFQGKAIQGADPKTFVSVDHIFYAKDAVNVYYKNSIVVGADVKTFVEGGQLFSKDKNTVYCGEGQKVIGSDPATFKLLKYNFATDKNNVYYLNTPQVVSCKIVQNANPLTFSEVGDGIGKDEKNVYIIGNIFPNTSGISIISGADPATFILTAIERGTNVYYAEDKNNKYVISGSLDTDSGMWTYAVQVQTR